MLIPPLRARLVRRLLASAHPGYGAPALGTVSPQTADYPFDDLPAPGTTRVIAPGIMGHPAADAVVLDALFAHVTGQEAVMWGPSIIGYGQYHYRYDSGHEGDMCRVGFSPRKAKHSLYISCACDGPEGEQVADMFGLPQREPAFSGGDDDV